MCSTGWHTRNKPTPVNYQSGHMYMLQLFEFFRMTSVLCFIHLATSNDEARFRPVVPTTVRYQSYCLSSKNYLLSSNIINSSWVWLGFKHFFGRLNSTSPTQKPETRSAILPPAKRVGAKRGGGEKKESYVRLQGQQQVLLGPIRRARMCTSRC